MDSLDTELVMGTLNAGNTCGTERPYYWLKFTGTMRIASVALFCMFFVTSCATSYQAEGLRGGFTETKLSENTYRVSFDGNFATPVQQAIDYALLRSAELALNAGYPFFAVEEAETSLKTRTIVRPARLVDITTSPGSLYTFIEITEERTSEHRKPNVTLVIKFLPEPIGDTVFSCSELLEKLSRKYKFLASE